MSYFIRVLSTSDGCVPLLALQTELERNRLAAKLSGYADAAGNWLQLVLSHTDGPEIALLERNVVEQNSLGAQELAEMAKEVANSKPREAAKWLLEYFPRIRCVYALQLLGGTDHKNGWEILRAVQNCIWSFAPGIFQSDGEGFSNEKGHHILWQFNDDAVGNWWMAVLINGRWQHFQMDLADPAQRESFLKGQIPEGAKRA